MATNHLMRVQVAPGILWLWQNGYAAACGAALCGFKSPSVTLMIRDQSTSPSPIPNPGVTAFNGASSNGRAAVLYTVDVGSIPAARSCFSGVTVAQLICNQPVVGSMSAC